MIVPEYWAEARQQVRHNGRSVTVRRFGWSDESGAAAQAHAEARTREALDAILAGADLPRRERRTAYGIGGVPIREQIVARHGDVVVTRNGYGALCLNTPDVLFADVDFEEPPSGCALSLVGAGTAAVAGYALGHALCNPTAGVALAVATMLAVNLVALWHGRRRFAKDGGAEGRALDRVQAFAAAHPDWHLRLYRTPAGLRLLAMHRTFSPHEQDAADLFHALRADQLYSVMCKVQNCFRARLTAKPWRIGMRGHIKPRTAAWSREQAHLPERLDWIADYERRAVGHAACRFIAALGDTARLDPKAGSVRDLHDAVARAESDLPLA